MEAHLRLLQARIELLETIVEQQGECFQEAARIVRAMAEVVADSAADDLAKAINRIQEMAA